MAMPQSSSVDICQRGEEIYEQSIRNRVEPDHLGEFIAIEIETGDFEIDKDSALNAERRLSARHPNSPGYVKQIGCSYLYRIPRPRRIQELR